ncbi:uncharacterized protein N7458_008317 [Penicillium daleae]|uniref:Uncharacterized protein n=1 Tax=Penicillium daleae TaxID=63821 RepID=A0AAD6G1Y2_9EURO|nr:uncharacterized protein N7458_008317 [Penicillium daleae]KAJ5444445.1 hypothetical protein N7458_008317 [Penicillium daleae]
MPKPLVAEALRPPPQKRPTGRTRQPELLSTLRDLHMFTSELEPPPPFTPIRITSAIISTSLAPIESPTLSEHPAGPATPHSLTRLQQ